MFRCDLKVISDDDEWVLCDILFHADMAEAVKAQPPVWYGWHVDWLSLLLRTVIAIDVHLLLRPETAQKQGKWVLSCECTSKQVPPTGRLSAEAPVTNEDCGAWVSHDHADGSWILAMRHCWALTGACQVTDEATQLRWCIHNPAVTTPKKRRDRSNDGLTGRRPAKASDLAKSYSVCNDDCYDELSTRNQR